MTYTATLPTSRDEARLRLGDTSNDVATEYLPDSTYDAVIVALGDWRLAAASLARSLAARAINDPTSFTAVGDMAVSWADRARSWLAIATALDAEAAADTSTVGTVTTFTMPFLSGGEYEAADESLSW